MQTDALAAQDPLDSTALAPLAEAGLSPGENWQRILDLLSQRVSANNYAMWFKSLSCVSASAEDVVLRAPNRFIRDWVDDNYAPLLQELFSSTSGTVPRLRVEVVELPEPARVVAPADHPVHPGLNPKYTFERFVAGTPNQLAHGAARAVAELPGTKYNPLFLYGGVGLGKTHLCQAIGHEIYRRTPSARIAYVSSEQFMNDYINALRSNHMEEFRRRYREECDFLLIDDIQFLAARERTQDEFFHTFNALYDSHRQIVLTSDQMPAELLGIEERLRTRFQQGLITDIGPPDVEMRVAILQKRAEEDKLTLPSEVVLYLAESIRSNVRELEGALVRLAAHASLAGATITLDLAKQVLSAVLRQTADNISVEAVQKAVADYYNVRVPDLRGPKRDRRVSLPRQVAMFLARKITGASYPDLGQRFGGKDHSTVISACRKIERLIQSQAGLRHTVEQIERIVQNAAGPA